MNPYQTSQDPVWHRWVDGLIILVIGLTAGIVLAQGLFSQQITTTEVIRQTPMKPQIESGIRTNTPAIRIEEG